MPDEPIETVGNENEELNENISETNSEIEQCLEQFRTAKLGEEVRGALIRAIKLCYADVIEQIRQHGIQGYSAYELAQSQGYTGTLSQWLDSLKGEQGETGPQGPAGNDGVVTIEDLQIAIDNDLDSNSQNPVKNSTLYTKFNQINTLLNGKMGISPFNPVLVNKVIQISQNGGLIASGKTIGSNIFTSGNTRASTIATEKGTENYVANTIQEKEDSSNKVQSVSDSESETQYPSIKCMTTYAADKQRSYTKTESDNKYVQKSEVDDELSSLSENPVQNKVVKAAIDALDLGEDYIKRTDVDDDLNQASINPVQNTIITQALSRKIEDSDVIGYIDDVFSFDNPNNIFNNEDPDDGSFTNFPSDGGLCIERFYDENALKYRYYLVYIDSDYWQSVIDHQYSHPDEGHPEDDHWHRIIELSGIFEDVHNKTTNISLASTDDEYPSARAVYSSLQNKANIATSLAGYGIVDGFKIKAVNDISYCTDLFTLYQVSDRDGVYYIFNTQMDPGLQWQLKIQQYLVGTRTRQYFNDAWGEWSEFTYLEDTYNKVTSISSSSTDDEYPTAKAVYTELSTKAASASTLSGYGITDAYTKTEVDTKISSVYKYKGSVATYQDLPSSSLIIGDVYNVETDGSNYAWTGTAWDKLGGNVDLSTVEVLSNKVTSLSSSSTDTQYPSARTVYNNIQALTTTINGKESTGNRVTSVSSLSDNNHYPTAKAVWNAIQNNQLDISGKADKSDTYTKAQIDAMLIEAGGANVVNSISDMTDTSRLYVLASSGHIYRYTSVVSPPSDEMTVKYYNKRISSSSSIDGVSQNGCFICDKIEVDLTVSSCIVTFKNFGDRFTAMLSDGAYSNSKVVFLDENESILSRHVIGTTYFPVSGNDSTGDLVAVATAAGGSVRANTKYVVFAPQIYSRSISSSDIADMGIYISTHGGVTYQWVDTGIVYGGGNEEALAELDARLDAAEVNISELAASGSEAVIIPSFWQNEVDNTINKIKTLQDSDGHDLLCFGWCSDMHVPVNGTSYEQNLGAVAARVMKECNIPLFLVTGDMLTADTSTTLANMPNAYEKAWSYLNPIGIDKILSIKGNHDAWTGNNGSGEYYIKGLPPEKLHNLIFRPQEKDFRRIFGNDGSYYYIDNIPQKVRFICLNSHWAKYEEYQDGTAKYSTQKGAGFGQEQLDWLINALNVDNGYSIVVSMHTPPSKQLPNGVNYLDNEHSRDMTILRGILTAYCGKTTYTGSYTHSNKGTYLQEDTWADVSINCNFSNYHGTLLGLFCGHTHYDQYVNDGIGAPIVCITSAINTPYDTSASVRVQGTSSETVMDFVCINRSTKEINLIRCGYGNDRQIIVS